MVRYVKFQGVPDEQRHLSAADFMLVIISEAQIAGIQAIYKPGSEVAMDSTHGTNAYDFQLTTVMFIDEYGEGFPGVFCFSNRTDESAMCAFLEVCKENIGCDLEQAILMTDDAESFYNAWQSVFSEPAHRLLCVWHIDRAWRKNLSKVTGDSLLKATVYKTLRCLLEMTDKDSFAVKLNEFLDAAAADNKTAHFSEYFRKEYAGRPEVWAYSYRLGLKVHHNMHLEALHRVLKHVHMNGRKVRRLDNCIHALLRLMRSKMRDRLLKIHKGKWTRHLCGIRGRHRKGIAIDRTVITEIHPHTTYAVRGSSNEIYIVEQSDVVPHAVAVCPLRCDPCGICIHSFGCTCVDFGLRNTVCKHIHAVIHHMGPDLFCVSIQSQAVSGDEVCSENELPSTDGQDSSSVCQNQHGENELTSVVEEVVAVTTRAVSLDETKVILEGRQLHEGDSSVQHYIDIAERHWSCIRAEMQHDAQVAEAVCEQLLRVKACIAALKSQPALPALPQSREPANKKAERQRYFVSTKKKIRKRALDTVLRKPNAAEKVVLLDGLAGDVQVVSRAMEGDHDYDATPGQHVAFEHSYM